MVTEPACGKTRGFLSGNFFAKIAQTIVLHLPIVGSSGEKTGSKPVVDLQDARPFCRAFIIYDRSSLCEYFD